MEFTYKAYERMINQLANHNYIFSDYFSWEKRPRCVILRHDIDKDIEKAVKLAEIENKMRISSTYFVLVTSEFYNVFSKRSRKQLKQIRDMNHEIGLHFDEVQYSEANGNINYIRQRILDESALLGEAIGEKIRTVSMHRPSRMVLDADMSIPGMINSYSMKFFHDFKYLSDSRRHWREPVEGIIEKEEFERLHILTHPFWYADEESDISKTVKTFINCGSLSRYRAMKENITDLESIVAQDQIGGLCKN